MSQPSMPFNDIATDPFLPSIEQEHYTQAQFDALIEENSADEPVFSSTIGDELDELEFRFDDACASQPKSSKTSTISTPDLSTYSFGQRTSPYLHIGVKSPHPYPLEYQRTHQTRLHPSNSQRPLPIHTHSNPSFLLPSQPPLGYVRRRSLSQNDADRIAATLPNPTFVRLQTRVRSTASEEKRRSGLYATHGKSAVLGPGPRGRPLKNPAYFHGSPLAGGVPIGTSLGTPFHEPMHFNPVGYSIADHTLGHQMHEHNKDFTDLPMHHENTHDPVVFPMADPTQLANSRRIIQIGAMAVRRLSKLDTQLEADAGIDEHERIMKKLEDVERHLKLEDGNQHDALKGCAMIRAALKTRKEAQKPVVKLKGDDDDALEAPSKIMGAEDNDSFGGCINEDELMALLVQENEREDCKVEED
jgi:hypothetical protein